MTTPIQQADLIESVAAALHFISEQLRGSTAATLEWILVCGIATVSTSTTSSLARIREVIVIDEKNYTNYVSNNFNCCIFS